MSTEAVVSSPIRKSAWARDFAVVGGVSSFLAPFLIAGTALGWPTLLATTGAGALSGAALGAVLARPMRGALGAVSWPLLGLLFLGVGACWGAVVGAVGATVMTTEMGGLWGGARGGEAQIYIFFMGCAALAAAAQLCWFGVAYARSDRGSAPTWPLLVAACGTPFLGWGGLYVLSLGAWLVADFTGR